MKKVIIVTLFLLFVQVGLRASECYHYHTKKNYEIVAIKGILLLRISVKDPNDISIVSQEDIPMVAVGADIKIINRDAYNLLLADNNAYYLLAIEFYDVDHVKPVKIADRKDVKATFDADLLCIQGKWFSFSFDPYTKKIVKGASSESKLAEFLCRF
ncbi:hypothetical protein BWD42_02925 [Sphingobacterium sp. CZ-UAM]|nr:hypothetical protein [Sphingobacterium sp. CZ-UAM]OOG18930.1 hypothetical protein BWD42_02925 [Sphingobacterium sp. CZ-UAM]